ncbi:MAG: WD40/YVTN/BNR-like repeat-containing protein, partial [Anaerolineae bacterium]
MNFIGKRPALGVGILVLLIAGALALLPLAGQAQVEGWSPLTQGLWGGVIRTLVISPQFAQDRTLFAGTEAGGVYRSLNAGESWTAVNQGLADLHIRSMAISPRFATDRTLYVGTESGRLFRSTDAGASWQEMPSPSNMPLTAIGLSPQYPSDPTMMLGFLNAGIFVSPDMGTTWLNAMWHRRAVVRFVFSPQYASDHTVWAVITWGGIYRSTNAGASWTLQTGELTNNDFTAMVMAPSAFGRMLIASTQHHGLYRSSDDGSSWEPMPAAGLDTWAVRDLAVSPGFGQGSDRRLYAATWQGVYASTDAGASWTWLSNGISETLNSINVLAISPDFSADNTLFAGSEGGGVFK